MIINYKLFYQYGSYQIVKTYDIGFSEIYTSNICTLEEAMKIMDGLNSYKQVYGIKILEIDKEEQDV